jgi:hypothetical protein
MSAEKNWPLRLATSVVETLAVIGAYRWAGWPGVILFTAGAVLIGCGRALVDAVEAGDV